MSKFGEVNVDVPPEDRKEARLSGPTDFVDIFLQTNVCSNAESLSLSCRFVWHVQYILFKKLLPQAL